MVKNIISAITHLYIEQNFASLKHETPPQTFHFKKPFQKNYAS